MAFSMADDVLRQGVQGILFLEYGIVNVDFKLKRRTETIQDSAVPSCRHDH